MKLVSPFFAMSLLTLSMQAEPFIIAHRGASGTLPEHTLGAYRLALEQGADYIAYFGVRRGSIQRPDEAAGSDPPKTDD